MTTATSTAEWYWLKSCRSRMGVYTGRIEQALIAKYLAAEGSNLSVLDVGGGSGRNTTFVKSLGHRPTLLEFNGVPINLFREEHADIPAVQASGLELPVADASFDAVITIEVTVCVTGENGANERFFPDVHRVLKANGLFLLTVSNGDSYVGNIKKRDPNLADYETAYYHDGFNDYMRKLDDAGFVVEACIGYRWIPFTRDSDSALIPVLAGVEKALQLRRLPRFSPWVFIAARKR